jgi:hypothetical protein
VEEESFPPYPEDAMTDLEKETMNSEDTMLVVTPQSTMGSNKLNNPPMGLNLAQCVYNANYLQCRSSPISHIKHHGNYLLLGLRLQQLNGVWLGLLRGMKLNLL